MSVTITLKPGKEASVRRFHPWIFSGAIATVSAMPEPGETVVVCDSNKKILGQGHFHEGSISVRMITFDDTKIDLNFWEQRLNRALQLRKTIGLPNDTTDMYRLVHGEGDGLPGLIIDVYGDAVVIQPHSRGMEKAVPLVVEALEKVMEGRAAVIYCKPADKHSSETPKFYKGNAESGLAKEHGLSYTIDWVKGQKTGFFIDQRENRALLGQVSKGKKVLNTFCYSGGFSLTALKGGASHVDSLDSSQQALELTESNVQRNFPGTSNHAVIKADAVEYLKKVEEEYDIIVLDPPAFAKHLSAKHKAVQGYRKINAAALKQIKKGGLLFTFSCSQAVDKETFKGAVVAAAIEAQREVRILHQLHQPADHPISLFHPEGEYLKGLVLEVK